MPDRLFVAAIIIVAGLVPRVRGTPTRWHLRRSGATGADGPRRRGAGLLLSAILMAACAQPGTPSATTTARPAETTTPIPTANPTPARADTLTIGWSCGSGLAEPCEFPGYRAALWTQPGPSPMVYPGNVVYSALYRYDARFGPVPDLADGLCLPQGDGTVIRCRLVETPFHDGSWLTAADVKYSYDLFMRPTMLGAVKNLRNVLVVDPRTVDFVLASVDPTFMTEVLPGIPILPRHAVETAYVEFKTSTKGLTVADLTKLADEIDDETTRDPPVCTPRLDRVEALLPRIKVALSRADIAGTCDYMQTAAGFIRQAATALGSTGLDAVAAAYGCFATSWKPIGTGPYRWVTADVDRVHLEAWPGYHDGLPATRFLDFVPAAGDGSDLVKGTVDIVEGAFDPGGWASARSPSLRVATLPGTAFLSLQFNVRPGRLFADVALRRALQLCIDLPRDVDAASGGGAIPIDSPVPAGSWAYDSTLEIPKRDTAAARALIEVAGWRLGTDGIYVKGTDRLSAVILVKGVAADRLQLADLIAQQARTCGMDLRSQPVDVSLIFGKSGLWHYPHFIPGTTTPFDLYLGQWVVGLDPADVLSLFVSSNITDANHPDGTLFPNFIGFADIDFDRLVADGNATYDQTERAIYYRQAQEELAARLPYLFLWTVIGRDVVRSAVTSTDGPLDLTTPNWSWQPERMVVQVQGP